MSDIVLIILLLFFIGYGVYTTITNYKWNLKPINNFPFMYRGKEYWYSRSVATTPFVFCKNENNEYCVLANKRGIGTPDFQGLWNVPCGYLLYPTSAFIVLGFVFMVRDFIKSVKQKEFKKLNFILFWVLSILSK